MTARTGLVRDAAFLITLALRTDTHYIYMFQFIADRIELMIMAAASANMVVRAPSKLVA